MPPTRTRTTDALSAVGDAEFGSAAQRERRKRILDATLALASKGGYDAVQMRTVAERADVALGTLYRYFPSKIHLLVSALTLELERTQDKLDRRPLPGETPYDRILHVLSRVTQTMQREPMLTEAMTRAFMFADPSAAAEVNTVARQMERMFTRAMQRDPMLTEAMTRAFMFADPSAAAEVNTVARQMEQMFSLAMHDGEDRPSADDAAIARVIGDVWLSNLVAWVTRRASADDVSNHLELAARLLLR